MIRRYGQEKKKIRKTHAAVISRLVQKEKPEQCTRISLESTRLLILPIISSLARSHCISHNLSLPSKSGAILGVSTTPQYPNGDILKAVIQPLVHPWQAGGQFLTKAQGNGPQTGLCRSFAFENKVDFNSLVVTKCIMLIDSKLFRIIQYPVIQNAHLS